MATATMAASRAALSAQISTVQASNNKGDCRSSVPLWRTVALLSAQLVRAALGFL